MWCFLGIPWSDVGSQWWRNTLIFIKNQQLEQNVFANKPPACLRCNCWLSHPSLSCYWKPFLNVDPLYSAYVSLYCDTGLISYLLSDHHRPDYLIQHSYSGFYHLSLLATTEDIADQLNLPRIFREPFDDDVSFYIAQDDDVWELWRRLIYTKDCYPGTRVQIILRHKRYFDRPVIICHFHKAMCCYNASTIFSKQLT